VYRDRSYPNQWYTAQMSTSDPDSQTTRTYTWTRPTSLDNKTIEFYIAGRYWDPEGSDYYKHYVATRPAGSFKLSTKDSPLEIEANPGRYYAWKYPSTVIEPYKEDNIVVLPSTE